MTLILPSEQVWKELEKQVFGVIGMVTARHEARTVGIVYVVYNRRLYFTTAEDTWKTRHIAQNPHVSMTIPIAKRIPFLPWIKIPAATITFSGVAAVRKLHEVERDLLDLLMRGHQQDSKAWDTYCMIEVKPINDFVTYGVGVSLMTMRKHEKAWGRAPVVG